MPEEGGDNKLTGGKMAKGCLSLTQVIWPALSSVPALFGLLGFALSVFAAVGLAGAELDPNRLRMCQWSPALPTVLSVKQQLSFCWPCPCARLSIPALRAHGKDIF